MTRRQGCSFLATVGTGLVDVRDRVADLREARATRTRANVGRARARGRLLALVLFVMGSPSAHAQVTGGSFGSSDWGDDDHDRGSSFGSSSWGSSSSGSSSSSSSGGSSGGSAWDSSDRSSSGGSSGGSRGSSWGSSWGSSPEPTPESERRWDAPASSGRHHGPGWPDKKTLSLVCFFVFLALVLMSPLYLFGGTAYALFQRTRPLVVDDGPPRERALPPLPPAPPRAPPRPSTAPMRRPVVDRPGVVTLLVGLDARARPAVQAALATLASGLDVEGPEGRLRGLHATLALLEAHAPSIAYESGAVVDRLFPAEAKRHFTRQTADLRARFRYELVRRTTEGAHTTNAPAIEARADEGEGFVVVAIVVAARGVVAPPGAGYDPSVAALVPLPASSLMAFEVIWSPALDSDRMSSAELETLYPELVRVRHDVGRVRCVCGVAYAAELGRCPSCGRSVEEALHTA